MSRYLISNATTDQVWATVVYLNIIFLTFWRFLLKIHKPDKWLPLITMKGKKSEFSSMTHNYHLFIHWKFTRPNIIQRNIILKNINLLLFNRNSKHLAQYLNFIIWVLSCLPQCKVTITVYCLIFGCVSKPHKLKMHFSEIFINIKLLSWMWCKDNFGLSIIFLLFTRFSVKS